MKSTREKVSYCLGLETGRNLQRQFNDMDMELLRKGFEDAIGNNNPKLAQEEIQSIMQALSQQVEAQQRQFYAKISEQNRQEGIKILYEDRYLVVLDKPDELLSVATLTQDERTVHTILKKRLGKPVFAVHRLDRDTSGLMMFAYTAEAQFELKKQFETHSVSRHYVALVEGRLTEKQGTWKSYLVEDGNYRVHTAQPEQEGAQLAITHYEVLGEKPTFSFLRFMLETGRKNQIRVHCEAAGHPILGDRKYGARTNPYNRLCLHAYELHFMHPFLKKNLSFKSPLPAPFQHFTASRQISTLK